MAMFKHGVGELEGPTSLAVAVCPFPDSSLCLRAKLVVVLYVC